MRKDWPGLSAFALEDGIVYHTYSTYARGLDGLWGMYNLLDRGAPGAQRDGYLVAPPRRVQQGMSKVAVVVPQTAGVEIPRRMASERASQQASFGASARSRCQRSGNNRLVRVHVGDG